MPESQMEMVQKMVTEAVRVFLCLLIFSLRKVLHEWQQELPPV